MSVKTFAAIDLGSFELTLKIFEFSGKSKMREIDCISHRLALGSDTYAYGKISAENLDELCAVLNHFSEVMAMYKVEEYRAYGTSAIRETENRAILLDRIHQRTGIHVNTISNSEQRFLGYKAVASKSDSFRRIIEDKTAILDIGGGSLQLSLFDNDTLVSTQNLKLGVLRILEYLNRFGISRSRTQNFIEELVQAQMENYKKLYLKDREIQNLIIIDDYISTWAIKRVAGDSSKSVLDRGALSRLLEHLQRGSNVAVANELDIPEEKVPLMFISVVTAGQIANLMGVEKIWLPGVTLCDGIAYEYAEKLHMFREEHDFERDILASALNISKRYQGSRKRAETLENISTSIFDSMKKIHGLGKRERLYLRLAAILHDCGKYISMTDIGETSYQIVMATEMIGLSHREREIVANIVRFNHSDFLYDDWRMSPGGLDEDAYLIVAKLTAILRVANGLDRSHKQKLSEIKTVLKDNQLILLTDFSEDISLEKGFFEEKSEFFKEVFHVEPILKQKKAF